VEKETTINEFSRSVFGTKEIKIFPALPQVLFFYKKPTGKTLFRFFPDFYKINAL
jgi:hypothetical protein